MENAPLISICIFNYNYGRFLRDAVTAALAQTYENIEVVVCDNASTDNSMDVLAAFAHDRRLRVFRNDTNIGWMRNHQRAVEYARGAYAVAIPADDCLLPSFCETAMAHLRAHRATTDVVYASVAYTDVALMPHINGSCAGLLPGAYAGGRNEFRELLRMDHIRWPVMLTPREVLLRFADFDESLHAQADWDALLAMSAAGIRFGYVPMVGVLIRRHADQCSSDGGFVGTTRELEDYLRIHERWVTAEHHWRFHGSEHTLLQDFARLREGIAARAGAAFHPELQRRCERYERVLRTLLAAKPPQRPASVPRVSVVVTTHGANPAALRRAFASLEAQESRDFEIVVVQSGGESLASWVATLPLGGRTRFFHLAQVVNPAVARNLGIRLSVGEFLAYLDDRAWFTPQHLAQALAIFEATDAAAVCADTSITVDGMRVQGLLGIGNNRIGPEIAPMVPAVALVHRFSCIEQIGAFAENLPILDDWHFFLTLAMHLELSASVKPTVEIEYSGNFFGTPYAGVGADTFAAILDMIYGAIPAPDHAAQQARAAYRARIVQSWPQPGSGPDAVRAFVLTLAGQSAATAATASI